MIQGSGVLLGTPSAFVNVAPDWAGLEPTLAAARKGHLGHAVVRGGDAYPAELADVVVGLQTEYQDGDFAFPGMHVTVETDGVYEEAVARSADLMTINLSPWAEPTEGVHQIIQTATSRGHDVQVVVLCESALRVRAAVEWMVPLYDEAVLSRLHRPGTLHFVLQPEGLHGLEIVCAALTAWIAQRPKGFAYPAIRVIPELKTRR